MLRSTSRLLPLALTVALFACQDTGNITGPGTQGQIGTGKGFTLLLTDAPGDFESAVVTISQVTLQGSGEAMNLLAHPYTGDLIDLQNGVATLVSGMNLPKGSYSQLRLVLSGAYIEVETAGGGSKIYASSPDYAGLPAGAHVDGTLQMPSLGQSGLKINLPGGKLDIGEGETIVMIDFDAAESFGHEAGNSGRWVMHPVVKATNVTFGGNALVQLKLAEGVTLPTGFALSAFTATLTPAGGGTPAALTFTDANGDGVFEAMSKGLVPGDYTLTVLAPTGLFVGFGTTTFPLTVTVGQKATTTQVVTITSAALPSTVTATLKLGTGVVLPNIGSPPAPATLAAFKAQLTPTAPAGAAVVKDFVAGSTAGTFEAAFANLAPGTYSLTILKPAGLTNVTYDVAVPLSITITGGNTEVKPFTITAASL